MLKILAVFIVGGYALTCGPSEYLLETFCCPKCPQGKRVKTHCTLTRSTSCTGCLEGTFMDEDTGREECFPCTNCGQDSKLKDKIRCTTTSNSVCEPLEGAYCVDFRDGGCARAQTHSSCKPGQHISERGTMNRDTLCSDCRSGTFSNGTLTSCLPHTDCRSLDRKQVKPGSLVADAVCAGQGFNNPNKGIIVGLLVVVLLVAFSGA